MDIAVQADPSLDRQTTAVLQSRIVADGKFLRRGDNRFFVKGVTYGTFVPDARGFQFPERSRVAEDFRLMAELGINTVRLYTPPSPEVLDLAAEAGLQLIVGLPWSQHVAFLDNRRLTKQIERDLVAQARELGRHPAVLMLALGNEVPAGVVRWHGRLRVERFLRRLYDECKEASPESLFTYVNFPPTEFLDLSFFDICAFNVYLHREHELRAYLARLQHVAGYKPLLLAEAGADSIREGALGQAAITAMHVRAAFEEGAWARSRSPGPTNGGVGGARSMTGASGSSTASGGRSRQRRRSARRSPTPRFLRRSGKRGPACPSSSARTTRPTRSRIVCHPSTGSRIPTTKSSS